MCLCVCVLQVSARRVATVPFSKLLGAFCVVAGLVYYLLIEMLQKVTHTRMYRQAKTERGRGEWDMERQWSTTVASSLIGALAASFATPSSNV